MDERTKTGFPGANEESLGAKKAGYSETSEASFGDYRKGYEDGIRELARRIGLYYRSLGASQTLGYMVEYTVKEKAKDILEKGGNKND